MKGTKLFPSLGSLEMPTNMFYTQRIQASLEGTTVTPVRPAVRKTECSLSAEMAIWKWDVQREESLLGEIQASSSRYLGLTENTPMGRPSDYSQFRKRNSYWWNTCTLLGVSEVFLFQHDRGKS